MTTAHKPKVLFLIIPFFVLIGIILLEKQKYETISEDTGEWQLPDQKVNQATNDTNEVDEQELDINLVRDPEKSHLTITHPAAREEKLSTKEDSLDLELPSFNNNRDFDLPIPAFQTVQAWKAQDKLMNTWPAYLLVHEELNNELFSEMDINKLSDQEIIRIAEEYREKFWDATKEFSATSYQDAYKASSL